MKYLIFPGIPSAALIAESTAPFHPVTLVLWYAVAISCATIAIAISITFISRRFHP